MRVHLFLLVWGARRSARKQAGCARLQWQQLRFRVWPRFAIFFQPFFSDAYFAVYGARRALRSKTWVSATLHRQGPRMPPEARRVCFGITGASIRPIPTLLSGDTYAQTPLDRPIMLFRCVPDFADAPESAHNGSFRHRFAAVRVLADFSTSIYGPIPKASFAPKGWP